MKAPATGNNWFEKRRQATPFYRVERIAAGFSGAKLAEPIQAPIQAPGRLAQQKTLAQWVVRVDVELVAAGDEGGTG
ncbi:MAG: hypothetical protein KDH08_23620, partial [Anaerolineae bacterium]|nr:hypothetical protein [Anaerolineae bacterium]MCB0241550.1 hypothetical protein [Anaerolineae bacterium]